MYSSRRVTKNRNSYGRQRVSSRPVKKNRIKLGRNNYHKKPRSWKWLKTTVVRACYFCLGGALLAGFSLLLTLGYQYLLKMPYFYIKNIGDIKIEGQQRLTTEQILQMGQIGPGVSLLAINPMKIEKNLYLHPWIEKVEINRAWPDHLSIRIQEHQPIAIVNLDSLYYLSRKGRLFQALNSGELHDLPIITGLKRDDFQLWSGNLPPLLTKFIGILESLQDNQAPLHLGNISEIHLDPERGLTLYPLGLKVGIDIGFQGYSQKFNVLQKVLTALHQRGEIQRVEKINLTYSNRVLVSLKSAEEASP